jgi:hypothetical protein
MYNYKQWLLQGGLLYRLKTPSKATSIRGDQEEKVVYKIIEGSGNLGSYLHHLYYPATPLEISFLFLFRHLAEGYPIYIWLDANSVEQGRTSV